MEKLFKENEKLSTITLQEQCDFDNEQKGNLKYYDCPKCLNRGYINVVVNDTIAVKKCNCMQLRKAQKNLLECGINEETFNHYTLDNFKTPNEWQKKLKDKVISYVQDIKSGKKQWFYIGAISGLGKTHLCTALSKQLIELGYELKYFMWKDELVRLKQLKKSSYTDNIEKYQEKINYIKNVAVLYIDDLFKLIDNFSKEEDFNIAYEIINARYVLNKITIISCEYEKQQLKDFDMAMFGRIYEKCLQEKGYFLYSKYDETRNYRLNKGEE